MSTPGQSTARYSVVIPTTGRESLSALLNALDVKTGQGPEEIILVDDRPDPETPLRHEEGHVPIRVLRSGGRGPAGARNAGWRAADAEWVVFLDDDVVPGPQWREQICRDLAVDETVAACQATIVVPLAGHRKPTDAERGTAGLADAWWITADMAYRRAALMVTGGFDEDFPRAFREDADLALRAQAAGYRLVSGERVTYHPVRESGFLASVHAQQGNADNALMRRKHGRTWRERTGEGTGRTGRHIITTMAAATALGAARSRTPLIHRAGRVAGGVWLASTAEFALRRISAGPRTWTEIARMAMTSALIPPVACWYRARGELRVRSRGRLPDAVLFDRDDTLIHDVPYNGDPALVRPKDGLRVALDRLRAKNVRVGVVSNQSGVARGLVQREQVEAVNAEVDRQLGPFAAWQVCMHGADDGCGCRKPAPALVEWAAVELGADPTRCVVIGDTGADVDAALAAGARAILVPTERTLDAEIARACTTAEVFGTASEAIRRILGGR